MTKLGMLIDLNRCAGCYACVVACQMQNSVRPGLAWGKVDTKEWGTHPEDRRAYLPHACMHCEEAPCADVCPTGASYKRADGIVMTDYEKCIACQYCTAACPYDARILNDVELFYFDQTSPAPYEEAGIVRKNVVEKCIFCFERVDNGEKPACAHNCPGGCRVFGDVEDPESDISKYIKNSNAIHIKGTSMYYVPTRDMDRNMLPADCKAHTAVGVWQDAAQPAGKAILGIAAAAVVGGTVISNVMGGKKDE